MKSFLKTLFLFALPLVAFAVYLFFAPYSKSFGYSYRKNVDCNTSWIYYRLFENPKPIDVAFLGTSHTGCGINDSLITRQLSEQSGKKVQVANLAYCTKGRNIQQVVFDDLLTNKQPQLVIVELLSEESTDGHKDFPYVSNKQQLFQTASWSNTHFIEDLLTALEARFHYFRKRITGTLDITPPQNARVAYSYTPFKFFAAPAVLEKHSEKKQKRLRRPPSTLRTLKQNHSRTYLSQMVALAKQKGTKVVFLYLPSYGTGLPQPKDYAFYQQLGEVWLPPSHIFKEQKNWVDGEHLNYTGAKRLGNWLQQKIASTLH